ncbi:hypothetical protein, partial [Aeromonas sp. s2]|uniref:hypothetical protein n=1 Tax=Aeromonas sp. s2 TaxID=3138484 RepID=UPI0034A12164
LAVGSWQLAVGSWQLAVGSWQLAVGSWQLAVQIRTTDTQTKRKGDPGVAFVLFVMAEAA